MIIVTFDKMDLEIITEYKAKEWYLKYSVILDYDDTYCLYQKCDAYVVQEDLTIKYNICSAKPLWCLSRHCYVCGLPPTKEHIFDMIRFHVSHDKMQKRVTHNIR